MINSFQVALFTVFCKSNEQCTCIHVFVSTGSSRVVSIPVSNNFCRYLSELQCLFFLTIAVTYTPLSITTMLLILTSTKNNGWQQEVGDVQALL